jgi:hypothetical protein
MGTRRSRPGRSRASRACLFVRKRTEDHGRNPSTRKGSPLRETVLDGNGEAVNLLGQESEGSCPLQQRRSRQFSRAQSGPPRQGLREPAGLYSERSCTRHRIVVLGAAGELQHGFEGSGAARPLRPRRSRQASRALRRAAPPAVGPAPAGGPAVDRPGCVGVECAPARASQIPGSENGSPGTLDALEIIELPPRWN